MESMINYFDQIKADEELKAKTKAYIRDRIDSEIDKKAGVPNLERARVRTMKKLSLAALPVAACAILAIGGYSFYNTPVNYISLDINPSVELGLNKFDKVVKAEGINKDGEILLKENSIKNMSAEEAIEKLALEAKEKGYIQADGSTVIAVTALSEQDEEAVQLRNQMGETLRTMIQQGDFNAVVYTDSSSLQLRAEARELGLSPGKYKMILLLQSIDPGIGMEQYRNARITDILVTANELLQQNGAAGSGRYEWNYEMIKEAAEQVQETNGGVIREQDTEQDQYRIENQRQDMKPNQNPTNQEQEQNQNQSASSSAIEQEQEVNQNVDTGQGNETQEQPQNQEVDSTDSGPEQGQNSNQSSEEQGGNKDNSKNPK